MLNVQAKLPWLIASGRDESGREYIFIENRDGREVCRMSNDLKVYDQLEYGSLIIRLANERLREIDDEA